MNTVATQPPVVSRTATVHTVPFWQGYLAFAEGQPLDGMPTEEHAEGWWSAAQRVGVSEPQDFATIETLAQLDAEEGAYHPPTPYNPTSYDRYTKVWNDTWAKNNGKVLLR